jgi:hypothetical protein
MGAGDDPGGKARMGKYVGSMQQQSTHAHRPWQPQNEMVRPDSGLIRWLTRCLLRVARYEWMALEYC